VAAEVQARLLEDRSLDGFLRHLAVLAAGWLGAGLSCEIMLDRPGRPVIGVSSDAVRAAERRAGSSLAVPVAADGLFTGAVKLYSPAAGAFGAVEQRRAESFAAAVAPSLTLAVRQAGQAELTEQLRAALTSRTVIDQAVGILMAQQRCTSAQAFGILRAASQNRNVKLRHIAADVIIGLTGRPPQAPYFRDQPASGQL
jgi:hypothetical protein